MSKKYREPFPAEILPELVSIDEGSGIMTWRDRKDDMFRGAKMGSKRACSVWNSRYSGKPALSNIGKNGYMYGYILGNMLVAHRIAYAIYHGEWPSLDIDHINGDRSDNSKANLRLSTRTQNLRNRAICGRNTSGVVGVSWSKACSKWRAYIKDENKQIHIGVFESKDDAISARKEAEKRLGFSRNHGEIRKKYGRGIPD